MKSATSTANISCISGESKEKDESKGQEFDECVDIACKKFHIPCKVVVNKETQKDSFLKLLKQEPENAKRNFKNMSLSKPSSMTQVGKDEDETSTILAQGDDVVNISTIYDTQNKLVEIFINEAKTIPRELIKILGIIIARYPFLTKITIKKSKIDKYTVYEMSRFLEITSVTDICLDGSTLREANFALLLQNTHVSSLSLSRCGINDVVCETIASQLHYSQTMQCYLTTLNLSINRITDVGARYLGLALRSNRCLRYLNLASNCITDEGTNHILKPLMYFPLTFEEINAERILYAEYLKLGFQLKLQESQDDLAVKAADAPDSKSKNMDSAASKLKKKKTNKPSSGNTKEQNSKKEKPYSSATDVRAENLCFAEVAFVHPFSDSNVKRIDGLRCCTGNMILCYLNLGYNNISYLTVKKLNEVVKYQSTGKSSSDYGLIKVIIEGNDLPKGCIEIDILSYYLKSNLLSMVEKHKNESKLKHKRISVVSFKNASASADSINK